MGTKWNVFTNNFDITNNDESYVDGPISSTDNAIVRWDGASGQIIQNSSSTLSDTNVLSTGELNLTTQLAVPYGGTGNVSNTAYAVICGGTTDTAALQSVASVGTAGQVLTSNGAGSLPSFQAASGGSLPDAVYGGAAASHSVNTTTAFAPVEYVDLGTIEVLVRAFDDTTEEYMQSSFRVPSDIDASGTVTFEVQGWSKTAAASKNVAFTFGHRAVANGEAIDGSYTDEDADDQAVDSTQDDLDIITWTETVSNLGWTAGDMVNYRVSRFSATTNNLTGDYYIQNFFVRIPRA